MTCSALKRAYRQKLRSYAPNLLFVFMDLSPAKALQRVQARGSLHFMPISLVESQFAALESPVGEPGVLQVDASVDLEDTVQAVRQWLKPQ